MTRNRARPVFNSDNSNNLYNIILHEYSHQNGRDLNDIDRLIIGHAVRIREDEHSGILGEDNGMHEDSIANNYNPIMALLMTIQNLLEIREDGRLSDTLDTVFSYDNLFKAIEVCVDSGVRINGFERDSGRVGHPNQDYSPLQYCSSRELLKIPRLQIGIIELLIRDDINIDADIITKSVINEMIQDPFVSLMHKNLLSWIVITESHHPVALVNALDNEFFEQEYIKQSFYDISDEKFLFFKEKQYSACDPGKKAIIDNLEIQREKLSASLEVLNKSKSKTKINDDNIEIISSYLGGVIDKATLLAVSKPEGKEEPKEELNSAKRRKGQGNTSIPSSSPSHALKSELSTQQKSL